MTDSRCDARHALREPTKLFDQRGRLQRRTSSGSLAMLAAMRLASSRVDSSAMVAQRNYRSGFGFHSRASFCASAICAGVMRSAMLSLYFIAKLLPRAADKLSHLCART
jgi:hypothetical protein